MDSKGAPQALQVADRWHLLKNISEMSERALLEIYPRLKKQPEMQVVSAVPIRDVFPRSQKDIERKALARQQRLQKYSQGLRPKTNRSSFVTQLRYCASLLCGRDNSRTKSKLLPQPA